MTYSVSRRYAQALFDLSRETGQVESVRRDLQSLSQLTGGSADLVSFLSSPVILSRRRREILELMFKEKLGELTNRFLLFLEDKNRLNLIEDMCVVFEQLYLEFKGVVKVNIVSAVSLGEGQVQAVSLRLKSKFNKDIELSSQVDPAILGGAKLQKGDTVYDYSFQSRLEKFRKQVMEA
jgi:F-type H+-transporting ATPase subunit delta